MYYDKNKNKNNSNSNNDVTLLLTSMVDEHAVARAFDL